MMVDETDLKQINKHIGECIKLMRTVMGKSQSEIADMLGVSFQQIQKYETGDNRISAASLWLLSQSLDVELRYFFAGLGDAKSASDDFDPQQMAIQTTPYDLATIRLFAPLSPSQKQAVHTILKALVKTWE